MKLAIFIFGILTLIVTVHATVSSSDENSFDQDQFDTLFKDNVKKEIRGGKLKRIWEKFLKDGIDESLDRAEEDKRRFGRTVKTTNTAQILHTISTIGLKISKEILKNITKRETKGLESLSEKQVPTQFCPFLKDKVCDPEIVFRSIDGSCNNLEFPLLGKSGTPYKRFLAPGYDDGLEKARTLGKNNKTLPNPRIISRKLFRDNFQFDNDHTHLIAFFGQFITHDFSMASVSADQFGIPLMCDCGDSNLNCLPMQMPSGVFVVVYLLNWK